MATSRMAAATPPTTTAVNGPAVATPTARRAAHLNSRRSPDSSGSAAVATLNDRHQLTEPLGREKPVQPSLIVLLVQRSRCEGRIESGVEPIAFSVGHRSVRGAPIGRRDRQVAAHPSRLLGACADIALPERPDCAHGDGDQRELPDRGALPSRSCDQGRGTGPGTRRTTPVIRHGLAAADLVPSGDRPRGVLVDRQPIR